MLVAKKSGDHEDVLGPATRAERAAHSLRVVLDKLALTPYGQRNGAPFSPNLIPSRLGKRIRTARPDLLHLHWVNNAFFHLSLLEKVKHPVVWTMHDMWPITGGCHYDNGCGKYLEACGSCPQLGSSRKQDLSRLVWNMKSRHYDGKGITFVAPSNWLAHCARTSPLLDDSDIRTIPNGIDTNVFRSVDKAFARDLLQLPQDVKLVLFGAVRSTGDARKGFDQLRKACRHLGGNSANAELVVFGASERSTSAKIGMKAHYLGPLNDDISLVLAYSAADVFVCPSLQENLANTVVEALACGVPTVAFDIGGMPDLIRHHEWGYLAKPYEPADLANGIQWCLSANSGGRLSAAARSHAVNAYEVGVTACKYTELYLEVAARAKQRDDAK